MLVGAFYFPTDYGIEIGELARGTGSARLRVAVRVRAYPYPGEPALALSGRRRAAQALFAYPRSVRRAVVRRGGDAYAEARHRHRIDAAARPDHHRQIGREPRPAFGRPLHVRDRRRLERRGDGEPRRALRHPLQAPARARAGDEGAVDAGASRIPRRVREFRSGLAISQAEAEAASADPSRRRDRPHDQRVVEFCDGWFPRPRGGWEPKSAVARLRQAATAAGRDPATLSITVFRAPPIGRRSRPIARPASSACCSRCRT